VNGQLAFSPPKTAAGKRTIGMPSFVARSLAVHIDLYALPGAEGLVFPSADGQPMRRSNFRRRVWEPATAEVGMIGFRFHDLRHTAATLAAASGTSLRSWLASGTRPPRRRLGTST
jgi:integrase